jgi:chromosome segregation ATPase
METRKEPLVAQLEGFSQDLRASQQELAELDAELEELERELDQIGDDAQLANVDLPSTLKKQQAVLQMMSAISKEMHEAVVDVIRKIGG